MDEIESLIYEIENDRNIMNTRFTASFLSDISEVFEKHGFGVTKAFLLEKQGRRELYEQATTMLRVLEKLERCPKVQTDRAVGRLFIKTLKSIVMARPRR